MTTTSTTEQQYKPIQSGDIQIMIEDKRLHGKQSQQYILDPNHPQVVKIKRTGTSLFGTQSHQSLNQNSEITILKPDNRFKVK